MLKKTVIVLTILLLIAGYSCKTYAEPTPKNEITINPFGIFWGIFNIEYERVLSKKNSIAFRLNLDTGINNSYWESSGFGFGASYRFFLIDVLKTKMAPAGFWIGPAVDFIFFTSTFKYTKFNVATSKWVPATVEASTIFVKTVCEVGYEWLFEDLFGKDVHLVLAPYAEVGFKFGSLEYATGSLGYGGFHFALGVSAGIAF